MASIFYTYDISVSCGGIDEAPLEIAVSLMDAAVLAKVAPLIIERGLNNQQFYDTYCFYHRRAFDECFGNKVRESTRSAAV